MKALFRLGLTASAFGLAMPASAADIIDCPLRDAPYSVESPVIDLLLNPQARALVDEALGGKLDTLPPIMSATKAPSFGAILTFRELMGMGGQAPGDFSGLDAKLRAIPVTDADRAARCERYDNEVPEFTLEPGRKHVLVFEKINGFKDVPSVDAAHAALLAMAERRGWQLVFTEKGGAMNPATLGQFDAVVWNNISGDVLTLTQRKAFRSWIENGGAFVGMHGTAGDPVYFWDWFPDTLIGARFAGHPMDPQFQDARVFIEDASHPAAAGLPAEWTMRDEWYSFKTSPRDSGARVIARLDESTYTRKGRFGGNLDMGEDHPIAWSKVIGKGRSFYSAIGHMPETYSEPRAIKLLEDGLAWAMTGKECAKAD